MIKNHLIPIVVEKSPHGERSYDLYSRLLLDRIIFLGEEVTDMSANTVVAQMLFLFSNDPKAEIHFYINSPGGSVTAGLAIYDVMQFISCDINTYCIGEAASMGAVLLCAGTAGKRFALPNSTVMIHQPLGGTRGQASDIEIHTKYMLSLKNKLYDIMCKHSGRSMKEMEKACDRDNFLTPEMAKKFGLIDEIVESKKKIG